MSGGKGRGVGLAGLGSRGSVLFFINVGGASGANPCLAQSEWNQVIPTARLSCNFLSSSQKIGASTASLHSSSIIYLHNGAPATHTQDLMYRLIFQC
jgi:hypothetical protein